MNVHKLHRSISHHTQKININNRLLTFNVVDDRITVIPQPREIILSINTKAINNVIEVWNLHFTSIWPSKHFVVSILFRTTNVRFTLCLHNWCFPEIQATNKIRSANWSTSKSIFVPNLRWLIYLPWNFPFFGFSAKSGWMKKRYSVCYITFVHDHLTWTLRPKIENTLFSFYNCSPQYAVAQRMPF